MLPTINGKQIIDCTIEDLHVLIENPDYRENEYLDYKGLFSVDQYSKGDEKQKKEIAEFRCDVCSFANADGGYVILGIKEEKGVPTELCGIEIKDDNPDKFEMRLKNYLQTIKPRMPNSTFRFLEMSNGKYIVLILIRHDAFAPYMFLENERDYRIYKRIGNSKTVVGYSELKNMFIQSVALEKEIENYRIERINFFRERGKERFVLFHVIPDTFVDSSYNKLLYVIDRQEGLGLSNIFQCFRVTSRAVPSSDGLVYTSYYESIEQECRINNNCIAEVYDAMKSSINEGPDDREYFPWKSIWEDAEAFIKNYITSMKPLLNTERVIVCLSIVGCEGVITEKRYSFQPFSAIDRDRLLIDQCTIIDISNDDAVAKQIKWLRLNYMLALGIVENPEMKKLLEEIERE